MDISASSRCALKGPFVVQIFERPFDIVDQDSRRPLFLYAAGEALLERIEADDQVGDRLSLTRRAHPHCDDPRQELVIASDVRDQVEQLLRRIWQIASLAMPRHLHLLWRA